MKRRSNGQTTNSSLWHSAWLWRCVLMQQCMMQILFNPFQNFIWTVLQNLAKLTVCTYSPDNHIINSYWSFPESVCIYSSAKLLNQKNEFPFTMNHMFRLFQQNVNTHFVPDYCAGALIRPIIIVFSRFCADYFRDKPAFFIQFVGDDEPKPPAKKRPKTVRKYSSVLFFTFSLSSCSKSAATVDAPTFVGLIQWRTCRFQK